MPPPPGNAIESIIRIATLVAPEYQLQPQLVLAVMTTEPSAASCSYAGFNSRTFCIATEAAAVRVSTPSFS